MQRADSLEKTSLLGKIEGKKRRGRQRMRWLDSTIDSVGMNLGEWRTGKPGVLQSMGLQRIVHDWATELIVNFGHCIQLYSHHPIEIQSHSLTSRSPPPLPSPSLPPDMCPNSLPQETTFLCFDTIAFLFLQFYLKGVIWYSYSRLTFT